LQIDSGYKKDQIRTANKGEKIDGNFSFGNIQKLYLKNF